MDCKQDKITLLRELLVTQMNHWMLFPIYVMLTTIIGDVLVISSSQSSRIFFWLAFGCLPFFLYLGRNMLKKFWSLGLLHVAVILLMFLIPTAHITIKIIHIVVGVGYVIYSVYLWATTTHKKDTKLYPLLGVGASVIMLFILHNQGHIEWDSIFVTILIIALGLYFIIYYIEQYQNFLTVNNSSAGHIPSKEMFRSGMGLVIGYTSVGLLILVLISNIDWLRGVLQGLKKFFVYLINAFFSLFPQNTGEYVEEIEETPVDEIVEEMPLMEVGETFWLWNVVDYVVEIAFIVLIIFVLIKAAIFLVKFIKSKLSGFHIDRTKITEEKIVDVREKCDIVRNKDWKSKLSFLQLSPKERIRNLYKKRVLASRSAFKAGIENRLLNRYTARESGKILARDELAFIYEKARYSNEECNNEDVKKMRNACK